MTSRSLGTSFTSKAFFTSGSSSTRWAYYPFSAKRASVSSLPNGTFRAYNSNNASISLGTSGAWESLETCQTLITMFPRLPFQTRRSTESLVAWCSSMTSLTRDSRLTRQPLFTLWAWSTRASWRA